MQRIAYYLALPLLFLISFLPFKILYLLSDVAFVLVYTVFKYRRKLVAINIQNSFPEKSTAERQSIEKKFYRHLCDLIVEFFKTLTMTEKEALERCKITPESVALFKHFYDGKKNLILVMGHYGNWEWGGLSISQQVKHLLFFIYKPLSNHYFDGLMLRTRSRFGAKLVSMNSAFREIVKHKDTVNATAFIADQTPPPETAHWTTFLNQETPVFTGTEKIAKKLDYPVVFINIQKIKRGFYELSAELLSEHPAITGDGVISDLHTKRLEQEIHKRPEFWLWSHRRWKYKKSLLV
jgi:KDO2-lipid IV(A) lauroyltransferase